MSRQLSCFLGCFLGGVSVFLINWMLSRVGDYSILLAEVPKLGPPARPPSASGPAPPAAAAAVPAAAATTKKPRSAAWDAETQLLQGIFTSFGKQRPGYSGNQRSLGFSPGRFFDEDGMFALEPFVSSVAMDFGAGQAPMMFDAGTDASHLVFMFEPDPGNCRAMEERFERDGDRLAQQGGCDTRWDSWCSQDRYYWFCTAISDQCGNATFTVRGSDNCAQSGQSLVQPAVSLASIIARIREPIRIKYVKIVAPGHEVAAVLGAGDWMRRLDYIRFELPGQSPMSVPGYQQVKAVMDRSGLTHDGSEACTSQGASLRCVFCRQPVCQENQKPPMGKTPQEVVLMKGSWEAFRKKRAPAAAFKLPSWATPATWEEETRFLQEVLESFGKQQPDYDGPQRLLGFQKGRLFDERGMFAFTPLVRSVAIDVGAAINPMAFDAEVDATQVVLQFEPNPGNCKGVETTFEQNQAGIEQRGGCDTRWENLCAQDRFLWFRAGVAEQCGNATFQITGSPYCGTLSSQADGSGLDPEMMKDPAMKGIVEACWQGGYPVTVPIASLESIIRRIPEPIRVKYMKIDAQGHDFKVLMSAHEQISRVDYVRFEMQVDPPPNRKMVKDVPSYAQVKEILYQKGFVHDGSHACSDDSMAEFSKAIREMECVFCRRPPCRESQVQPMGPNPADVVKRPGGWASLEANAR